MRAEGGACCFAGTNKSALCYRKSTSLRCGSLCASNREQHSASYDVESGEECLTGTVLPSNTLVWHPLPLML